MNKLPENIRNPYTIADILDLKVREARALLRQNTDYVDSWGKPALHPHIISRRHIYAPKWPHEDLQRIYEHKKLHDEGKVTMCQGRDGEWLIQYAIPNNPPVKRETYFFCGDYY